MYRNKTPMRYQAQLNGKTAQENYKEQRNAIFQEQRRMEKLMELEKEVEREIYVSMMAAIENDAAALEQDMSKNVVNSIEATFNGGSIHPERLNSFSKSIAIGLGKMLGNAPFKLLEDFFKDEENR